MIKVGPPFLPKGTPWDQKGKTEIAQILISCSRDQINFMYFVYVEDGGTKRVLFDKFGEDETSHSMETVTFDYPSEYITRISGQYINEFPRSHLCSVTFYTNKGTYGPYIPGEPRRQNLIDFNHQVGGKFCGFFGSYNRDSIESLGFYMDPLEKLANQPAQIDLKGSGILDEAS